MSSIIASILDSTVGLLINKARDTTANKLKEGDVTDAKIREVVVRGLNDVTSKLDDLSRKDLLCSSSFLRQGVEYFLAALDQSKDDEKLAMLDESSGDVCVATAKMSGDVEADILGEKALELSDSIGKLNINSDKKFETAKGRFIEARKTATHAFWNKVLSIEERILAAKVRVVSEIFEWLQNPETAITGCLSSLRELHSLPDVREIFSVYLNRGVKALLYRKERVENVKSVMVINHFLFQFVSKFTSKYISALTWPTIEVSDRQFNPILHWLEISMRNSMGDELAQHPNRLIPDERIDSFRFAINSRREIVVSQFQSDIAVIARTGESKVVKLPHPKEGEVIEKRIVGVAVDKNNNVYVVRYLKISTKNGHAKNYLFYVLDENYNLKHDESSLDFLEAKSYYVSMDVNKNNDIIMIKYRDPHVYICDDIGQLKYKFERDSRSVWNLSITDNNEILTTSSRRKVLHIYTEEGELKFAIKLPEGHKVLSLAFHHVMRKTVVLTSKEMKDSCYLLYYSETGELENASFFCKGIANYISMASHPSGPVAVAIDKSITFI